MWKRFYIFFYFLTVFTYLIILPAFLGYAMGPLSRLSCPVCLSVTLIYIVATGQTVGWIKMKLGIDAGLDPVDIVLDGDPALPEGAQPPIFCQCLLWSNGWMDQDTTW